MVRQEDFDTVHYPISTEASPSDQAPVTEINSLDPDIPLKPSRSSSGWSLPITWIMLVGLVIAMLLVWKTCG